MKNVLIIRSGYRMFSSYWWKHYLRPRLYIGVVKNVYQRVTRGWADCDTWSLDSHLAEIIPEMINHLKNTKQGIPSEVFPKDYNDNDIAAALKTEEDDKVYAEAERKWNSILDEIILGFQAYQRVQDHDWPDHFNQKLETSTGVNAKLGIRDSKYDWDSIYAWKAERMTEFHHAMELLTEYFSNLWD